MKGIKWRHSDPIATLTCLYPAQGLVVLPHLCLLESQSDGLVCHRLVKLLQQSQLLHLAIGGILLSLVEPEYGLSLFLFGQSDAALKFHGEIWEDVLSRERDRFGGRVLEPVSTHPSRGVEEVENIVERSTKVFIVLDGRRTPQSVLGSQDLFRLR